MYKRQSHIYIAIDLKSFYASVECVERECDPLTTNLVVADESRTEKTICLAAVSYTHLDVYKRQAMAAQIIKKMIRKAVVFRLDRSQE